MNGTKVEYIVYVVLGGTRSLVFSPGSFEVHFHVQIKQYL